MLHDSVKRRDILQVGVAAGLATVFAPSAFAAVRTRYDPAAKFDLTVSELEYRRTAKGRSLMARIYQPSGPGPFPVVLDLHGGAWNAKDRHAEEPFDRALPRPAPWWWRWTTPGAEAPYPACVRTPATPCVGSGQAKTGMAMPRIGLFGSSSGGHVAEFCTAPGVRYNAIAFASTASATM
jgi:acetyl esterase/lipase